VSYPRASRTIEAIGWREEPMVLVCAPGHRLAGYKLVTFDDLANENVIGFDGDLTIRREIDRVLQIHDVEVNVVMEFDNIETIKRAVEIDAGLALVPEPTVQGEVAAGSLVTVPLATNELVRPLGLIHRRGKELGSTTHRFIELLQSEAQAKCHCQEHAASNGEAAGGVPPREYALVGNGSDHHGATDSEGPDDDSHSNGHSRARRVGAK
jgi:DNA-binding transcriptional LysR family regulator